MSDEQRERLLIIAGMLPWPLVDRLAVVRHIQAFSQEATLLRGGATVYLCPVTESMATILASVHCYYETYAALAAEWRPQ